MKKIISYSLVILFLASCSASSDVASNKLFQKRKYQKGWNVNSPQKFDKSTSVDTEEVAYIEEKNEEVASVEPTQASLVTTENPTEEMANAIVAENKALVSNGEMSKRKVSKVLTKVKNQTQTVFENTVQSGASVIKAVPNSEYSKNNSNDSSSDDDMLILLYILAVLIPFVAVGIVTDWDIKKVLINILLSFLCYIPGVIHAFITIRDYYR